MMLHMATGCLQRCYTRLQGALNDVTHGNRVPTRTVHTDTETLHAHVVGMLARLLAENGTCS